MVVKIFSKEDVNIGRQTEADFAKFVCLVGMVIVHCFDVFVSFSEASSSIQYLFLYVLNGIFGAGTFMFCMGLGLAYSSKNEPMQIIKRGIRIFLIGYLLNIICAVIDLIFLKDVGIFITYLIGLDILQFAGLALVVFGLLKKFSVSDILIGIIAVILSVISTIIGTVDIGDLASNVICGLFIGSFDPEWFTGGVFPLFNWFIFVVAGYLFAKYLLRRCENKNKLYLCSLIICGVIIAVYMAVAIPNGLGMMGSIFDFYHIRTHEALIAVAGAVLVFSAYHFVLHIIPEKIRNIIVAVSRSINTIYCCQWVIIALIGGVWAITGNMVFSDGVIILIGLAVFVFCAILAELLEKCKLRSGATAK